MITIFSHVGLDVICEEDLVDLFQYYNYQRKISLKIHEDSPYGYGSFRLMTISNTGATIALERV